ncbi:cell envelope integrity protein CreD [Treponema pectinovorum]|uniref:cell envelope integrity protein CreD n=1 Tax=Treponema pectinovorum TaxID=164 RepID=UPI0011CA04A0|nr:cell envelope integrity protein CreD [Treponema pectinovorum]
MKKLQVSKSSLKIMLIFVLVLLFLVPISLIKNLIYDRKTYQDEAVDSITEPLGGESQIEGVVIAVPYKSYHETTDSNGIKRTESETKYIIFAPDTYKLNIQVNPYYLTRGIFKVPVFNGQLNLKAEFADFDFSYFDIPAKNILKNESVLILGLSNTKTLTSQPKLNIAKSELKISPIKYDSISPFTNSVYYNLAEDVLSSKVNLTGIIDFQGGENLKITPIASDNTINIKSNWPSPSFSGGWLPNQRQLSENGFSALWNIAGLSTVYSKSWKSETEFSPEAINVSFITPVDAYKKTERSVKYSLLFLIIPFIALLISEIFSNKKIHPVQYCLIGLADVIFYLLLLSISEHILFDLAYLICSVSVCLATLFYASAIFKNIKWGALLSGIQLVSYIFLYGTLQAEDYALLIGSIGLFIVTVLLMFITRKIDWYQLNEKEESV